MLQTRGEGTLSSTHRNRSELTGARLVVLVYVALAVGIIAAALLYHVDYAREFRAKVEQQLASIAALKVSDLEQYRKERIRDAEALLGNLVFSEAVQRFLEQPTDETARGKLQTWLTKYPDQFDYVAITLLDATGAVRMAIPQSASNGDSDAKLVAEVLARRAVVFRDFYRSLKDGRIYCSLLVPVFDETSSLRPLGVVILQIDPHTHLYPVLGRWPAPTRSAETLLVRRDGNDALFLNELRYRKNTALNLRVPLVGTNTAAVMAILGRQGSVRAVNYRGKSIFAHLEPVPNSPWFLVARMDQGEVLEPLSVRLWQLVGFVAALLFGAGGGLGFIWRQRATRHYREQAERSAALQAVTSHQEVLLSTLPDIILKVDNDGTYTWANQAGVEFFGEDVIGRTATFDFADKLMTYRTGQSPSEGSSPVIYTEGWQQRHDGESRLLACHRAQLKQSDGTVLGALFSARDVTQQRKTEQELAVRTGIANVLLSSPDENMYEAVLQTVLDVMRSPFGIFGYLDESNEVVIAASRDGMDHEPSSAEASGKLQLSSASEHSIWPQAIREKRSMCVNQSASLSHGGKLTHERQVCVPIVFHDEVVGLFQVADRDTEYTKDDQHLLDTIAKYVAPVLHARLQRQRREEELRQLNGEMMRFTYTASHDLKSPLVTVTTFLGYLEKDIKQQATDAIAKDFEFIHNATVKMSLRLDEVLALSRAGRQTNPSVEVPLQAVVNEALQLTAGRLAQRRVAVEVTNEPVLLFGDRPGLVEIFQNLIDNAAKLMGAQPAPLVQVGAEYTREGPVLFVRDNGMGIDPRHKGKLFGLFEKLDPHSEGTGMGLALVQRIVQVHGGAIWVESEGLGLGTTFRFTLAKARRATDKEWAS